MQRNNHWMLVADSDEASRSAVCDLIGQLGFAAVVARSGTEALAVARGEVPSLVILDVDLADLSAYEVCCELREQFGETLPIVFVSSTRTSPQDEIAGLLLGADDYFKKPVRPDLFLARLRRLVARSPARAADGAAPAALTPREREVLALLVEGRCTSEIAAFLYITPKTVATHIDHILTKLGAHSQAQAVAFAVRDNIVGTPPSSAIRASSRP